MKNPAAALNLRHCSRTSTELLSLLLFCLLLSLSFSIHPVRSKSDTSNREEPVQWQILTKHNFSSQIRLNPHILLIVTVPWSGESRSLMKELAHMVNKKKEVFRTLKLMFVHKNHDKMLADALGATMEINIICYRHSLPYKYQGTLWIQSILSSARYLMSLLPEEIPLKSLPTADDLTTFLKSTDKALLVLEFCGWTPKLMAKVMNNGSENAFGVPLGAGLYGVNSEPNSADGIKNQGKENEKISCDVDNEFNQLPGLNEFAPVNESDFMESEKLRSNDGATCSFEEFQLFESSLYNFTTSVRDFFLPPERLKFGLVSERSLISSLGVADTSSWLMMLYTSGCPTCAKVFKEGSDLKRIIEINASPVMELKGNEYDFDPGLPSDKPSVLLFIDRSSDSSKTRTKSKESLTIFRELASHNHAQNIINPHNPFIVSQHPKLEMSTSSQQLTSLKDKIHIMAMKAGKHITFDDIVSNLQGSSFQEVLTQVLQKKKQTKLSSLAKDVGFQLLSDDIDITIPETNPQSDDHKDDNKDVDLTGFNCSFFFIDGKFRLLENLSGVLKIPSLVIIDPLSNQHYVYPKEDDFSYSSLSNFLYEFLNGSLVPYQRSRFVVSDSKVAPHPPFVNQDFHEVDSIPRVSALSFMELVVGNQSGYLDSVWKKDVLVLFTSSWCGFCLRTELVVREVYQSFKGYGNMVNTQFKNQQSSSRNDDLNDTILKLPLIYMMDCTENDCSSLLKSSTKRDLYPSLVLYPAESKEAITYDGETSVLNIIKFIADQGGNSHWIYKERGILWTEAEQVTWNEKPFTDDISLKNENNEILLKDRIGTHKSDTKNNIVPIYDSSHLLHEILPGSILVATQKLHSIYPFSKSKILIVKVNTTTGFQGLIINKQISWDSITQLDEGLDSLKEAPLSYGGPVIAREMPLVSLTRESSGNEDYPEVLPDIYFLDQLATINLIQNLKLHNRSMTDYWFFVGYSSWGWDQLFDEIADGSWNIVDGTEHKFDWPMT